MSPRGRAVVLGIGRSGQACARTLAAEGWDVLVADRGSAPGQQAAAAALGDTCAVRLGPYGADVVDGADLVCPSPGVAWDAPELERARTAGVPVRSEMDLVFERCRAPIVGITGTNGKTTTTALTGAVLAAAGRTVHVGGNIGDTVIDRLGGIEEDHWLVLELSSFQLESVPSPRCRVAAVLNVTPDHLDRHHSFEAYAAIKARVVDHADPSGAVVLGWDDMVTRAMAACASAPVRYFGSPLIDIPGTTVRDGRVVSVEDGAATDVMAVTDIPLFGDHNVGNVLAAVAIARAVGIEPASIAAAVRGFRAVPHRLEPVAERGGVLFVNDSKATNADAAVMALRAFGDRPVIWIGGGQGKGVGPDGLADVVVERARHAVLNGGTGAELDAALERRGFRSRQVVATLAEAVAAAVAVARPGDVVLLAPGYTSFDQFRDFEERGRAFTEQARAASVSPSTET